MHSSYILVNMDGRSLAVMLSLIINGQGSSRDLFAPILLFSSSFTTGLLSSESDKNSKLSFGRVDDKKSLLLLESEIQIKIHKCLHNLLYYMHDFCKFQFLIIFLYTSFCTKTMNYISLYAFNEKITPTKNLYGEHICTHICAQHAIPMF